MKKFLSLAIMAAMFVSCVKDRNNLVCPDGDNPVVFTFGGNTRAATGHPVENVAGQTNAGVIPEGYSFGVYAWEKPDGTSPVNNFTALQNMQVTRNTSGGTDTYTYSPVAYWSPNLAATMSFMSYYPWTDQTVGSPNPQVTRGTGADQSLKIDYEVSTNSGDHIDLMYARTELIPGYDPVPVIFGHALARLMFQGRIEDFPAGSVVEITGIKVKGSILDGQLTMLDPGTQPGKPVWTYGSATGDIEMLPAHIKDLSPTGLTGTLQPIMVQGGDMLVLPQNVTGLTIEVTAECDGYPLPLRSFPLDGSPNWTMNEIITYDITIRPSGISFTVTVIDWGNENRIDLTPKLEVNPNNLTFAYNATGTTNEQTVAVTTNRIWNITGNDGSAWLYADGSGNGDGTITVYPTSANNSPIPRTATITVTAGLLTKTITVTQEGIDINAIIDTPLPNTYIGAFWRAAQTGERIIRIADITDADNVGDWMASVAWVDGRWSGIEDIVLSTDDSDDQANLGWVAGDDSGYNDMNNPTNDALYQVAGDAQWVSGTVATGGEIFFRIGLKSQFAGYDEFNNPARYAVVLLAYNLNATPKYYKIFLRQGEGADNVTEVTDNGWNEVKWSPYNVGNWGEQSPHQYGNGGFVDYPSKSGYMYQWGYSTTATAIKPYPPQGPVTGTWGAYTDAVFTLTDVCPTGYRMATGELVTGEMRSVYLNPTTTGLFSAWGYYADGYFDRRMIVSSVGGGVANSAVSTNSDDVAYLGGLVYNPSTNASLFFPATGQRNEFNGGLAVTGLIGYYWSSNELPTNPTMAYMLTVGNNDVMTVSGQWRSTAHTIRCIKQ